MSALLATVAREARAGGSPGAIAARLGRDEGLVAAALAELERLGMAAPVPTGCGPCPAPGDTTSVACRRCPLVPLRRPPGA